MFKTLYVSLLILSPLAVCGQSQPTHPYRQTLIKVAPLAFLEPVGSVLISLEQRISPKMSAQVSYGYGWPGLSILNIDDRPIYESNGTWQVRGEVRLYTGRFRERKKRELNDTTRFSFPIGRYFAIESFYKDLDVKAIERANPENQRPIYRTTLGGNLKVGSQFAFGGFATQTKRRFLLDVYTGLGVRYHNTQQPDRYLSYPADNRRRSFGGRSISRFPYHGSEFLSAIVAGFQLSYLLR